MAARTGMNDARALRVLGGSFVAGLLCAAAVSAAIQGDGVTEPFFGLDAPASAVAATPAPVQRPSNPSAAAASEKRPVGDLAKFAEAIAATPPERLALEDAAAPTSSFLVAQAVPVKLPAPSATPTTDFAAPAVTAAPLAPALPDLPAEPVTADRGYVKVDGEAAPPPPSETLKALVARVQRQRPPARQPPLPVAPRIPSPPEPAGAAPLPGAEWTDPDSVNWADAPDQPNASTELSRLRGRIADRLSGQSPVRDGGVGNGRLLDRLRSERRAARDDAGADAAVSSTDEDPSASNRTWPRPTRLYDQFDRLDAAAARSAAGAAVAAWSGTTRGHLEAVLATEGPHDPAAAGLLLPVGDAVEAGMLVADRTADATLATDTRRAALAVARRVAVWRAAAAVAAEPGLASGDVSSPLTSGGTARETPRLLAALEAFESAPQLSTAMSVRGSLGIFAAAAHPPAQGLARAVRDHYLAPNVRVAVHQDFVSRLLPETTVNTGPLQDFVLGRKVRGTRTVEQSTDVRFVPDASRIRLELLVNGEVASRTVTEAGPVAIHSRGAATFVVRKPITVSAAGLGFGAAVGTASNASQLADIETSFDGVPIMGSIVRNIARTQHDESHADATREVNDRIITRACREVDSQAEPQFTQMAERVRERIWEPLVGLGLEPTPIALETSPTQATIRLRLAGDGQLAAHTPRPRAPDESLLSLQVHESAVNNATDRLGLAGRKMSLEELITLICERLGIPPRIPDDLPEDVSIAFAAQEPLRIECRDGLVHVRVALDALESGRRNWYDIVARVAYRPTGSGAQVLLEREGPVQVGGPGHQGRMEIALRTIFGKVFAKERPVRLLPDTIAAHPKLADARAVQTTCAEGWFALALAATTQAEAPAGQPPAARSAAPPLRILRR
jgi:hypothetical protein